MTTEEIKTEEVQDVTKSASESDSIVSLLGELVRKQDSRIDSFEKRFDALETLLKTHNANPVDSGVEAENKPKTEDSEDVGDKVTIENDVAPKPSEAQASIIAPATVPSGSDNDGLKMENKMDDDKKEEKKEEVEKTDDDEDKEDVKKSVSGFEYEIVETVRPVLKGVPSETDKVPTGYQVLKSIVSGWNGKYSSAEQSLVEAYNRLNKGEFGTGWE